jgi:hypothetical protein
LGGVGKTQLATEYAYRYASEYEGAWRVRAEQPASLAGDYALPARQANLPDQNDRDQTSIVESVRRWLWQNRGWLLIFDNVVERRRARQCAPVSAAGQQRPGADHVARPHLTGGGAAAHGESSGTR